MQGIDLPGGHPLVGRYVPDLWLSDGSRLADHGHDGGFLLFDGTPDATLTRLATPWAGRVNSVRDDDHTAPAGVLVRPDGVIAWASDTTAPPPSATSRRPCTVAPARPRSHGQPDRPCTQNARPQTRPSISQGQSRQLGAATVRPAAAAFPGLGPSSHSANSPNPEAPCTNEPAPSPQHTPPA
jgi:hypothetical protein